MNKTLRFTFLTVLMLIFGKMAAQQVTLDFSTNAWNIPTEKTTGGASYTNNGYTINIQVGDKGDYRYDTKLHNCLIIGTNDVTLTLPAFNFAVSKIEVVGGWNNHSKMAQNIFVGNVPVSTQTTGYDANISNTYNIDENYQVAGTTFTLKVLEKYSTIKQIKIYKVADGSKKSPALQFSAKTVDYTIGDVFNAPTFTKQTTAAVTFTSDNEEVATVDANGKISVTGKAAGTATITAKAAANDLYNAGTATCTINVAAKESVDTYKKVTTIESGKKYLIVAQSENKTYYAKYMDKTGTAGNGVMSTESVEGYVDELKVDPAYTGTYTIEQTDKGYTIKDSQNRYLSLNSETSQITASASSKSYFTIEPQSDGTFKIAMDGRFIVLGVTSRTPDKFGAVKKLSESTTMPMLYMLSDSSTGISNVPVSKKVTSDAIYNLAGQRVGKDYKGIVIVNGKKTVQK